MSLFPAAKMSLFPAAKMSLFTAAAITEYSSRVSSMLTNYELYNREKFHEMYFGASPKSGPVFNYQYYTDMNLLTNNGMDNLCSNAVGRWYTINTIKTAFAIPSTYDILFALDKGVMDETESTENTLKMKMRRAVVGVIIVQKGECINRRESLCVKVICVRPNTVRGSVLMGACLYCIKNAPDIQQECLLELTDGYSNLPAFYSYTALGFLRDDTLWGERCFNTEGCMPMCANLNMVSIDNIIEKVLGPAPSLMLSMEEDPSGLWNRKCEVTKYKKTDTNPGYVVLKEIQTISNVMLGLTLLKNAYKPDIPSEVALLERCRRSWLNMKPNTVILTQLSAKLNAKLGEFDKLTGASPSFAGKQTSCTISGGRLRKKSRNKKSRSKKSRSKKSRRLD